MKPSSHQLPSEAYQDLVNTGQIRHDHAQIQALKQLDRVYTDISRTIEDAANTKGFFSKWFASPEKVKGCYLWGGVGTGKTMLMDLICAALGDGVALRTHFHRFMADIHAEKKALSNQQNPLQIIARGIAKSHKVICLDEFTISDITDAMIMSGLLKGLFEQNCVLITTSNTQITNLYKDGLQRDRFLPAIELLEENLIPVHVDQGHDYRMTYLQDEGIFHYPADANARSRLLATFKQLTASGKPNPGTININGRNIEVLGEGSGTVWFDFDQIARSMRSNSDFIEIAKQYHSVMVSNIPIMDANDNDAARRFIELVDELYDRNVNLIVSSDALPQDLYQGTRLAEPFRRTISRLVEMSSRDYLTQPHLL